MTDAIANAIRFATNSEIDGYYNNASTAYYRAARLAHVAGNASLYAWCMECVDRCAGLASV
jgi:hypothetical protein